MGRGDLESRGMGPGIAFFVCTLGVVSKKNKRINIAACSFFSGENL